MTPCDEIISIDWDILAQWNARPCQYPGKLLRLVILGKRQKSCRLKILMIGYLYDGQCLAGGHDCFLEECDLHFSRGPGGKHHVHIGAPECKQIGPFEVQNMSTAAARAR